MDTKEGFLTTIDVSEVNYRNEEVIMDWATFVKDNSQALFTLGGVMLGALITFLGNYLNNSRERAWKIEDRRYQRRIEVLNIRLKEAEIHVNEYFEIANKLSTYEYKLIIYKDIETIKSKFDEINPILRSTTSNYSSLLNVTDEELFSLSQELFNCISKEFEETLLIEEKLKKKEIFDQEFERKRINYFYSKVGVVRMSMIKRIDELRGFQN